MGAGVVWLAENAAQRASSGDSNAVNLRWTKESHGQEGCADATGNEQLSPVLQQPSLTITGGYASGVEQVAKHCKLPAVGVSEQTKVYPRCTAV